MADPNDNDQLSDLEDTGEQMEQNDNQGQPDKDSMGEERTDGEPQDNDTEEEDEE
jgi:hypothetical protein